MEGGCSGTSWGSAPRTSPAMAAWLPIITEQKLGKKGPSGSRGKSRMAAARPYLSLLGVCMVLCPLGRGWWEMGGETLAAENEVELEVLVVRSRPSCLMLSSTGWAAVTSFQSCCRSEGHTAGDGMQPSVGDTAQQHPPPTPPSYPALSIAPALCKSPPPAHPSRETPTPGSPRRAPQLRTLPWGRLCRGTVPWPGGRLTSPWRCRFNRCCCWSCCICRSCCWNASCLFPNGCWETKGRR